MKLVNTTKLVTGFTMSTDKDGREWLVVVAKGTYGFPEANDREPTLVKEQLPLVMTDVIPGEAECSAVEHENDFAPCKPRCDVLLNGTCHAPGGRLASSVEVGLKVGQMTKAFRVIGDRRYQVGLLTQRVEAPRPFSVMPIGYGNAFGGVDRSSEDPAEHKWYSLNHAGVGYHLKAGASLDGKPMPNTEELGNPVTRPDGSYKPMAFGPIARAWSQRLAWAGTYDQDWLDTRFPFLPQDFETRYFQSAPDDQQTDYPRGGEDVVLWNLTPEGRTAFKLPTDLGLPVLFFHRDGGMVEVPAVVDTVLLEPDKRRVGLVWRASTPLRRNIREVVQVKVGQSGASLAQERAREERLRVKRRFRSLTELVDWAHSLDSNDESLS